MGIERDLGENQIFATFCLGGFGLTLFVSVLICAVWGNIALILEEKVVPRDILLLLILTINQRQH